MGIITRLYNQRFNIYRVQTDAVSDIFEADPQARVLASIVKGRLTTGFINEPNREGASKEQGMGEAFKQRLFIPDGTNVKAGDFIVQIGNTSNSFFVDYISTQPGGESSHHMECILTSTSYIAS